MTSNSVPNGLSIARSDSTRASASGVSGATEAVTRNHWPVPFSNCSLNDEPGSGGRPGVENPPASTTRSTLGSSRISDRRAALFSVSDTGASSATTLMGLSSPKSRTSRTSVAASRAGASSGSTRSSMRPASNRKNGSPTSTRIAPAPTTYATGRFSTLRAWTPQKLSVTSTDDVLRRSPRVASSAGSTMTAAPQAMATTPTPAKANERR